MFLMSNSIVFSKSTIRFDLKKSQRTLPSKATLNSLVLFASSRRRRLYALVPNAKRKNLKERSWWQKFFFDDGNWFGLKEDDMLEEGEGLSEDEKFEAWKSRAEAISELREAQEDMRNEENRAWEDWLGHEESSNDSSWSREWADRVGEREDDIFDEPSKLVPEKGVLGGIRSLVFGDNEDDLLYEDRVFRYASLNSAKFLAFLVLIPWASDFLVHDYVLMPFLDRYVQTVPLAAEMLDVRRSQKLEMIKTLKLEKARYQFEVVIGKSPPLSDVKVYMELRNKAIELRDEWRLENKRTFANIFSDFVYGVVLFLLMYFNQSKVALLKFTGYKLLNNIPDTGKAFLIILITDIFLGYHSESGWQTVIELILEHYGVEVDRAAITIFICIVPVVIDASVKLWLFKFLPKISPTVTKLFREMKRH